MKIQTVRFGEIEAKQQHLINFPNGLLGFEELRQFCVFNKEETSCFWWLQSVEKPEIAFLISEPHRILPDYSPELTEEDMETLCSCDMSEIELGVILTIPEDPRETTANLLAPIMINTRKKTGAQILLHDDRYPARYSIMQPVTAGNSSGGSIC